jgi:hypothetical protein
MKRKLLTTAAFVAVLLIGATAQATDNTFGYGGSDHNWSTPGNWSGGVPDATENAVIPAGETCDVDISTAVADTIGVYGTLNIEPGMKLTLDGSTSSRSCICGTVYLEKNAATPPTAVGNLAFTTNGHELIGNGSIIGADHSCQITLDTNSQVLRSNGVTISGALEITEDTSGGDPTNTRFINDGTVSANLASGMLELDVDHLDTGTYCASGDWDVSASSATLRFTVGSMYLCGKFSVSNGTLDIDDDVWTDGDLSFTSGTIDVANGVSFKVNQDAKVYYFYASGGSGPANDPNYWYTDSCAVHTVRDDRVPGPDDRVVICSGQTCNVTEDTAWDTVDVDGTLNVQTGYMLTLQNDDDNLGGGIGSDNSNVDGTISLAGSGSTLSFTSDHNVSGSGSIVGQSNTAVIEIADNQTLTNTAAIEGPCQIVPAPCAVDTTFVNNGVVCANAAGTLEIAPDSIGVSSGDWCVSTSANAIMHINAPSAGMHSGDICVSNGTLIIDNDFTTSGSLCFTGGTIIIANGVTFSAAGGGSCTCTCCP